MATSERIATHLRSNVIGYLALFVALSGTAIALPGHKSVKADDLANGAVKTRAIGSRAVTGGKLASAAVKGGKLASGAVTEAKLKNGAVDVDKLADSAVERKKIKTQAVTSQKIANGAIDSSKVADGGLLASNFASGQISDGFATSGTANLAGAAPGVAFSTGYDAPRAGRLYLLAGAFATLSCPASCSRTVAVFVDGTLVSGSSRVVGTTIPGGGGDEQRDLTLTGIATVSQGAHTVEVRYQDAGAPTGAFSDDAISGILLQ